MREGNDLAIKEDQDKELLTRQLQKTSDLPKWIQGNSKDEISNPQPAMPTFRHSASDPAGPICVG